ncbi:MAG TPA: dienelactone hydrolase family protein [Acidimicrobiales bacterium]|nr:dienelactone hydrolase family protein [Acidimicrobiales bacterium]
MTHNLRADTISITGFNNDEIEAYLAVPTDVESVGSMIIIHHMPGYDEGTKEIARKFASHGYAALIPNLYYRVAPGASPDDAAATQRSLGGVPDEQLVGDAKGAMDYLKSLPISNGKVGVIGFCSGGRQSFLVGLRLPVDAVVDCYGAFVSVDPPAEFPLKVKSLIGEVDQLHAPLLGLFGAEDQFPSPEQTEMLAQALTAAGKEFTFRTFEGAGHAFFMVDRVSFRPEAAIEGWKDIFNFLERTLA